MCAQHDSQTNNYLTKLLVLPNNVVHSKKTHILNPCKQTSIKKNKSFATEKPTTRTEARKNTKYIREVNKPDEKPNANQSNHSSKTCHSANMATQF